MRGVSGEGGREEKNHIFLLVYFTLSLNKWM
jgi:hypothetical protein